MHKLIETTFTVSAASDGRCFWLSGADAIKPVACFSLSFQIPPGPAAGPDLPLDQTHPAQDWSCPRPGV